MSEEELIHDEAFTRFVREAELRFGHERSHRDSASAQEYTRLLINLLVTISGVAITALITLAGTMKDQTTFATLVGLPCIGYMASIVCAVSAAFDYANAQRKYANDWHFKANRNQKKSKEEHEKAKTLRDKAEIWIKRGVFFFGAGSFLAIMIILSSHKPA